MAEAGKELFAWGNNRRFNAYSDYLRRTYGFRLQKLSVNAGFSCPNRDGSKGTGGCVFCNNEAFNPSYCQQTPGITEQLNEGKAFHAWRYRHAPKYLAYFQAFSNTYAPLPVLKARYEEALGVPDVAGLAIGTRPDCVDDETLDYLADLAQTKHIHLEMGIESCYDKTLQWMNRGHDFATARKAFEAAAQRGLFTGTHLILGLPGLSREEELAQAGIISHLPVNTLKLHQLQIIKHTALEKEYAARPQDFSFFTVDSYVDFAVDFLERLSPQIMMERFAGEAPARFQAGPTFGNLRSDRILQLIEKRLEERGTWQGRLFSE
ncbi:MAG: TIGR01212 family radical SAM protein [Bacteroides sp.]|nr:TIGR01212 family radical SAM protein [Bacteroides sp.]MCM1085278.1 TIGR01212 family radical SAM protein [Bacteroides sp.]